MGFQDSDDIATMYQEYLCPDRVLNFQSKMTDGGIMLAKKIADSLEHLMNQMTFCLLKIHERKEKDRKMKAKMKEITAKFPPAKRNREVQEKIAMEEKETR